MHTFANTSIFGNNDGTVKSVVWFSSSNSINVSRVVANLREVFPYCEYIYSDYRNSKLADDEYFYQEPAVSSAVNYLKWALEFCRTHGVKYAFIDRYKEHFPIVRDLFEREGIVVICENTKLFNVIMDVEKTYKTLARGGYVTRIPKHSVIPKAADLGWILYEVLKEFDRIDFRYNNKFTSDKITTAFKERNSDYRNWFMQDHKEAPISEVYHAFEVNGDLLNNSIVAMGHISDPTTVNLICCPVKDGNIATAIIIDKGNDSYEFCTNKNISLDASRVQNILNFEFPFTLTYKKLDGKYKLTDINSGICKYFDILCSVNCNIFALVLSKLTGYSPITLMECNSRASIQKDVMYACEFSKQV